MERDKPAALCAQHALDGMVNVVSRRCAQTGCDKIPSYGKPDGRAEVCVQHSTRGMVDIVRLRKEKRSGAKGASGSSRPAAKRNRDAPPIASGEGEKNGTRPAGGSDKESKKRSSPLSMAPAGPPRKKASTVEEVERRGQGTTMEIAPSDFMHLPEIGGRHLVHAPTSIKPATSWRAAASVASPTS